MKVPVVAAVATVVIVAGFGLVAARRVPPPVEPTPFVDQTNTLLPHVHVSAAARALPDGSTLRVLSFPSPLLPTDDAFRVYCYLHASGDGSRVICPATLATAP